MTNDQLNSYLGELIGKRCEGADNPIGSVVRFDIGPLGRGPHDEADSEAHGWRHLTVKSPWRLEASDEVLCDWNAAEYAPERVAECIARVVGVEVQAAEARTPGCDLRITWANGLTLLVFADANQYRDDAWFILGTDGFELTAGPTQSGSKGWRVRWVQ